MDIIKLLPDSVANQIAAGEVIQRPASVVKELVENSVDAGATSIVINIKDAGRTLIQIVDNGCGMSTTDARMAFERHATSKIRRADDLLSLHTMGFRGEALPSVAAVSEIDLRSMRRDDDLGTHIVISASKVESQTPEAMVPGTNIMVKRLFFNLPARRKFLKKDSIELSHIMREFERLALVNTNIEFSITHNDVLLHKLQPGSLKQRITELFGKTFEHQLLPVETHTSLVNIEGFVGLPTGARKRGALQFFFVNGRYMRHPYFHKAVLNCYSDLLAADTQPNYFINLTVDPETIDVNIHPQKYEIKFENEQPVWQILSAAVKEALGRFNVSGALDFNAVDIPDIPAMNHQADFGPLPPETDSEYNPFDTTAGGPNPSAGFGMNYGGYNSRQSGTTGWENLYDGMPARRAANLEHVRGSVMNQLDNLDAIGNNEIAAPDAQPDTPTLDIDSESVAPGFLQLKNRYIVTTSPAGILVIDQHRAHTLILYQRYIAMLESGDIPSQRLIFPDTVTLEQAHNVIMSSIEDMLQGMGFDISNLGGCNWAINAVPAILGNTSPTTAFTDVIMTVADQEDDVEKSQWQKIALSIARSAAIKYGTPLTTVEMQAIVTDLMKLPAPSYTPDGRTVLTTITTADIARLFA